MTLSPEQQQKKKEEKKEDIGKLYRVLLKLTRYFCRSPNHSNSFFFSNTFRKINPICAPERAKNLAEIYANLFFALFPNTCFAHVKHRRRKW